METINLIPARNTENTNIEKTIAELNALFERLTMHEIENNDSNFGYAGIPYCLKRARETGVDKIFFVGRDYHGKYEDDDCYFTYWDEVTKEFFSDEWSTRFAAPSYDLYEMPINFKEGWEAGLIDKNAYLEKLKEIALFGIDGFSLSDEMLKKYNLRVSIEKGRKWKGEGYLVDITESSYRFATPMYRNRYYGTENFGVNTTHTAEIWNPMDNTINRANANYLIFLDKDEIYTKYIAWAKVLIKSAHIGHCISSSNNANYFAHKLSLDYSFETFMNEVWMKENPMYDISTAYDPEEEEKKKKASEFRATKMPELIEWVKTHTDKKGPEIMKLAINIFNKKYSN